MVHSPVSKFGDGLRRSANVDGESASLLERRTGGRRIVEQQRALKWNGVSVQPRAEEPLNAVGFERAYHRGGKNGVKAPPHVIDLQNLIGEAIHVVSS